MLLPNRNSDTCPGGGESHGTNTLPRADGIPFIKFDFTFLESQRCLSPCFLKNS